MPVRGGSHAALLMHTVQASGVSWQWLFIPPFLASVPLVSRSASASAAQVYGGCLSPLFRNRRSGRRVDLQVAPQPHAKPCVHRMPFIVQCDLAGHARSLSGRRAAQAKQVKLRAHRWRRWRRSQKWPCTLVAWHPTWPGRVSTKSHLYPSPSMRPHTEAKPQPQPTSNALTVTRASP